jgi:hypothetical protein
VLGELRCGDDTHVVAVIDRNAGRTFPIADAYSFHIDGEWRGASPQSIRKSKRVTQAATASRRAASGNTDRLSTLWREVISVAGVARSSSKNIVGSAGACDCSPAANCRLGMRHHAPCRFQRDWADRIPHGDGCGRGRVTYGAARAGGRRSRTFRPAPSPESRSDVVFD